MNRKARRRAAKYMRATTGLDYTPLHERVPDCDPQMLAQQLDREWFRSHPGRSYRIRPTILGETAGADGAKYVVVRQMSAGVRVRLGFDPLVPQPEGDAPEQVAREIFDTIAKTLGLPTEELSRGLQALQPHTVESGPSPDGSSDGSGSPTLY